jgi:hypothetical protein
VKITRRIEAAIPFGRGVIHTCQSLQQAPVNKFLFPRERKKGRLRQAALKIADALKLSKLSLWRFPSSASGSSRVVYVFRLCCVVCP